MNVLSTVYNYKPKYWGFGEAIAIDALLDAGELFNDKKLKKRTVDHFQKWWELKDSQVQFEDHVTPSYSLVKLVETNDIPDAPLVELTSLFFNYNEGEPPVHRPDKEYPLNHHLWVDCLYTDGRFFSKMIKQGHERFNELLIKHFVGHIHCLYNEKNHLFSHGYEVDKSAPNNIFWGRGNGWALYGILDTYENLPTSPIKSYLLKVFKECLNTVIYYYDSGNKGWHTVLDHPETYIENSLPALFSGIVYKACRLEVCDKSYLNVADESFYHLLNSVNQNGQLLGVSDATPVGNIHNYNSRKTGSYIWGQGALLRAFLEKERLSGRRKNEDV